MTVALHECFRVDGLGAVRTQRRCREISEIECHDFNELGGGRPTERLRRGQSPQDVLEAETQAEQSTIATYRSIELERDRQPF
jgi:hypothetical protein